MRRIIINADDCGKSATVNSHIEKAIEASKISSTTVMANMDDFEGALCLYKNYHNEISFGWHLNLTEGAPLLKSQVLLDYGYYREENGVALFNGIKFWKKKLPEYVKKDISNELHAQYEKLRDSGFIISHVDSHHHIHTSPSMLGIIPNLCNELGLSRVRSIRNFVPFSISYLFRKTWREYMRIRMNSCKMTQYFCSYKEYCNNPNMWNFKNLELMCHPGSYCEQYSDEENLLFNNNIIKEEEMINFYQL